MPFKDYVCNLLDSTQIPWQLLTVSSSEDLVVITVPEYYKLISELMPKDFQGDDRVVITINLGGVEDGEGFISISLMVATYTPNENEYVGIFLMKNATYHFKPYLDYSWDKPMFFMGATTTTTRLNSDELGFIVVSLLQKRLEYKNWEYQTFKNISDADIRAIANL